MLAIRLYAAVLTIVSIHGGPVDKGNIIPEECVLRGTLRHVTIEGMESMVKWIKKILNNISKANGAQAIVEFQSSGGANKFTKSICASFLIYKITYP